MTTRRVTAEAYCGPCTDRERCAEFARTNNLVGLSGGVLRHRPNHEARLRPPPAVGVRRPRRPAGTGEPLAVLLRPGTPAPTPPPTTSRCCATRCASYPGTARHPTRPQGPDPGRLRRLPPMSCWTGWSGSGCPTRSGSPCPSTSPTCSPRPGAGLAAAYDADGEPRPGAWVLEVTGLLDLSRWPPGMRVIVRRERPHPGAQLRITDADGHRLTAFATNTAPGGPGRQLADLELRHRRRARAEDRIRCAKDTGLTQPAAARPGPEPDLVRHRRARLRAHRLGADARPRRAPGPPVGTQTAPAAAAFHRRHGSPAPHGAPSCTYPPRTLGQPAAAGDHHPARARRPRLTRTRPVPTTRSDPGPWNRRPPERPRPNCRARRAESPRARRPPTGPDHRPHPDERSGLGNNARGKRWGGHRP